jgi:Rha family phage regulatory protein
MDVSAWELHGFLDSQRQFTNWFDLLIRKYKLVDGVDYSRLNANIGEYSGIKKRGRPSIDYALTIAPDLILLIVLSQFPKTSSEVLRDIENLSFSQEFSRANFGLTSYVDTQGREQPMYYITKDGFSFLVMGYNGWLEYALSLREHPNTFYLRKSNVKYEFKS